MQMLQDPKMSLEPDLNQRPKDICMKTIYSPPLYQLSYRGLDSVSCFQHHFEFNALKRLALPITKQAIKRTSMA